MENRALAHHNTVFSQILKLFPRHEFETLVNQHQSGRLFRAASRWSQLVAMAMAQLSGRNRARDVVTNMSVQAYKFYQLGCAKHSRSTLSRINENKLYTLLEALFGRLLRRCQVSAPHHGLCIKNKLYLLDASTNDLYLSVFPWANLRRTKGGIKLRIGLNHDGYLPKFVTITDGKTMNIEAGRTPRFPKGSIVVFNPLYDRYAWYNQLTNKWICFIPRLKADARYCLAERHSAPREQGLTCKQTIRFTGIQAQKERPLPLRHSEYRDLETGKRYVFLAKHFDLRAKTIADIYKHRWQMKLFFK
jgi:hypothetical protein